MKTQEEIKTEPAPTHNIKIKLTERDCPRCDAVLIHNDNEQCHECLNCGYIDCGSE